MSKQTVFRNMTSCAQVSNLCAKFIKISFEMKAPCNPGLSTTYTQINQFVSDFRNFLQKQTVSFSYISLILHNITLDFKVSF